MVRMDYPERTEKMVQMVCPVRTAQMGKTVEMGVTERTAFLRI